MSQKVKTISLSKLVLWTENPRDPVEPDATDRDIIFRAIENESGNWELGKMLSDIGERYYYNELPTVVETDGGKFVVYDGNRRIAVIKCLQDPELYELATNSLPLFPAPQELLELTSLPCNVCDKETALDIVERLHGGSGKWGRLQYEQFEHHHRGKPKGRLMIFDEATDGEVARNSALNEEYVQNRLLTDSNLNSVGLAMVDGELRSSLESTEETMQLLSDIVDMKKRKLTSARKNPGDLLGALREFDPEKYGEERTYDDARSFSMSPSLEPTAKEYLLAEKPKTNNQPVRRRKPVPSRRRGPLFGKVLMPSGKKSNTVYRAIDWMWKQYCRKADELTFLLPIMGFSLRLLLESVAREYYMAQNPPEDKYTSAVGPFMKNVVRPAYRKEASQSLLAESRVASVILGEGENFDSLLHNWAHGSIDVDETLLYREAAVLAEIIERFGE